VLKIYFLLGITGGQDVKRIIKATTQFPDGSPIKYKGVLSKWHNDCGVLAREKYKIT
jgi:hypothetical protein